MMMSQKDMQQQLDALGNYPDAIDYLFNWSQAVGYLDIKALKKNPTFSFLDLDSQTTLQAQVNIVRSLYTASQFRAQPKNHCPICFDWVASSDKPLLRAWEVTFPDKKPFFLQLSPFPLASKHLVLIEKQHTPMRMDRNTIVDLAYFLDQAPSFTALSNSDVVGAGASVTQHHHYQAIDQYPLPIMQAKPLPHCQQMRDGVSICALHFPMASLKLSSHCSQKLATVAGEIIMHWKRLQPGKNTWNLALRKEGDRYDLWLIARCSDNQTNPQRHFIKREYLGIVEVAGEAIYPTPQGDQAELAWEKIRHEGLATFLSILQDNNPLSSGALWDLIRR